MTTLPSSRNTWSSVVQLVEHALSQRQDNWVRFPGPPLTLNHDVSMTKSLWIKVSAKSHNITAIIKNPTC